MAKQVQLGDTQAFRDILAKVANLNARLGLVERETPRGISSAYVDGNGHLNIVYTDGSSGDAGLVVGGTPPSATIDNTRTDSVLLGSTVSGFMAAAQTVVDLINSQGP
jgi:hypothetical protein